MTELQSSKTDSQSHMIPDLGHGKTHDQPPHGVGFYSYSYTVKKPATTVVGKKDSLSAPFRAC